MQNCPFKKKVRFHRASFGSQGGINLSINDMSGHIDKSLNGSINLLPTDFTEEEFLSCDGDRCMAYRTVEGHGICGLVAFN